MEYKGTAYHSGERCFKCGGELWLIVPKISGWEYYCPKCKVLTTTREVLDEQLKKLPEGVIGVVSAVPYKLQLLNE